MIEVIQGDIAKLEVDAIVNAANSTLLGGGGVDGAIHRAAGPKLLAECITLMGCKTGDAKITKGYNLPAKHVIHTVGPVWNGGKKNELEMLALCYRNSLFLAVQHKISTLAFPCISTGVYHFPKDLACKIAVKEVLGFMADNTSITKVIFACFGKSDVDLYNAEVKAMLQG
jgi:O-acetyl-ADP-ribose deacetylase (regulator of RNase III)